MPHRISLIGYRACGKSTIGPLLARRLGWTFVDADRDLEARLGQSIASFFATHGEDAFRDRESAALAALLSGEGRLVLATGGGVVLRDANRRLLRDQGGLVAYLHAPAAILQGRLRLSAGGRPSLSGKPVWEEVPELLAIRDPLYRETAGLVLDATRPPAESVLTLAAAVEKPVDNMSNPRPPAR